MSEYDTEGFKHLVAYEIGIDLNDTAYNITLTKLGDTIYRIDLSIGKYHANTVVPVLSTEQARNVAVCFSNCIKKWESEVEELQKRDSCFKQFGNPKTWDEFAEWVDEYMQLHKGSVKYKEEIVTKVVCVPPTILESITDILLGYWPRKRKDIVTDGKLAIIKVVDEDGTTIVHTAFDADALVTFDGARVVEVGKKLKRFMDNHSVYKEAK